MEKIKSRWRKNYLEAKDDNGDPGGYHDGDDGFVIDESNGSSKSNSNHHNHHHHHNHNHNKSNDIENDDDPHHHHHQNNHHNNHHHHHHHNNNINNNSNSNHNNIIISSKSNSQDGDNNHHHKHNNNNNNSGSSNSNNNKHSKPPIYEPLDENLYLDKRRNEHSRSRKDARSMVCDCILTKEERARGVMGCLDDCLNRMLMIECGPKCSLGDHCLNKRFQKLQSAKVEPFKTKKKGFGLRAMVDLPANTFIMEYVGEVVRTKEFKSRVKKYTKQKVKHHYFMALRSDEIIDATVKGNVTRFINHSCEPNCETQKWTVNGDPRIGFFTLRDLKAGDEITFDYQFQRYGRKAQKCYCEAPSCRGYIGGKEQAFSLNGNSSPQSNENKAHKKSYKHSLLIDVTLEDKINSLASKAPEGLKTKDQVIALASLSIKAEDLNDRRKLLDIIRATKSEISLRLFVDYHGLEILCLWMRDPYADCEFKAIIIEILDRLPIPNKTKVQDSHVLHMIERWATEETKAITPIEPPNSNDSNSANDKLKQTEIESKEPQESNDISSESQLNTPTKKTTTPLPPPSINSPNIKALASKLLKKFQALQPGFKIPRLNRMQRIEIEKKMEEEVIHEDNSSNEKTSYEQKTAPFARTYFKPSGTNGLTAPSTTLKPNTNPVKRRFDALTNNIDLTPTPKISKEEHRQQFEINAKMNEYYDAIKKNFGAAVLEQVKLSHPAFAMSRLPIPPLPPVVPPFAAVVPQPTQTPQAPPTIPVPRTISTNQNPHLIYPNMGVEAENHYQQQQQQAMAINPILPPMSNSYHYRTSHLHTNGHPDPFISSHQNHNGKDHFNNTTQDPYHDTYAKLKKRKLDSLASLSTAASTTPSEIDSKPVKPEPTNLPTLIVLANNSIEPAHIIDDELAFSICDYNEYYTVRDEPLKANDLDNNPNPYPGIYYTTPSGETWFAAVTLDRKTQRPRTVILKLETDSATGPLAAPPQVATS